VAGTLAPGARLPSTRVLAADLGVARNTVVVAFDQLRAEGYTTSHRGGGTRVCEAVPDSLSMPADLLASRAEIAARPAPRSRASGGAGRTRPARLPHADRSSERATRLAEMGRGFLQRPTLGAVPFQVGVPALDSFPARVWARLVARRWRRGTIYLGHADAAGHPALRAAIAAYVTHVRAARCTADEVIVVSGAQQALHLAAQTLLDPGEPAWVEDPGYVGARLALAAGGARIVPVPVDGEGLDVEEGERLEPHARIAYVTPSHQYPLGTVMSAQRRLALLAWARRAGAWILEDDYDSEFRYEGRPLPSLQGLDAERGADGDPRCVLYVGTFNKSLAPGLRLGYLIVPEEIVPQLRTCRIATDLYSPTFEQGVLADFIAEGHYARHLRRVRALYAERQAGLLRAAGEEGLGGLLALAADPAGLHLLGWLPDGISAQRVAEEASAEGVVVHALAVPAHRDHDVEGPSPPPRQALLLGYAGYDEELIRAAVGGLGRALRRAGLSRAATGGPAELRG